VQKEPGHGSWALTVEQETKALEKFFKSCQSLVGRETDGNADLWVWLKDNGGINNPIYTGQAGKLFID
jgi:hypothetical protein